jgi:hypothetical protein
MPDILPIDARMILSRDGRELKEKRGKISKKSPEFNRRFECV